MVVTYFFSLKTKGKIKNIHHKMATTLITHTMLLRTHLESCRMLSNYIGPCILGQNHLLLKFCPMIP